MKYWLIDLSEREIQIGGDLLNGRYQFQHFDATQSARSIVLPDFEVPV